ncbi:BRO1-domain-containing protein [Punctularia strigosozonata HHB-11173 SS5]|uniref:BRO1-domain-containing protein n=1 Tax=Punctularia strigosozonata (strain HHB-11173) TaxID=741275 RepID=R7S4L8_PUNST|nr:BRO1-domain-containing protein [Punctularia strigosozonata HHB-11173 SS5]EIN04799.1 BRO1-domain-containing protein [Punctularia strigosozonata HHB-11173 SS5]
MSNQLAIPFKKTWPLELRAAVRAYIAANHPETHPDAFQWDVERWETLRAQAMPGTVHIDKVDPYIQYHAQLVFILTKLPPAIGLEVHYASAFAKPDMVPLALNNLLLERAAVVFNLAALYSQLATREDRTSGDGIRRASALYQNAAGTLEYLANAALPKLQESFVPGEDQPIDLANASVESMRWLMLAQAQECSWQRATTDSNYKDALIARLAMAVSSFYGSAASALRNASFEVQSAFPSNWLAYLDAKRAHFEAAAQYRKGQDDANRSRFGEQVARLRFAKATAQAAYDTARRGGVASAVFNDAKSLLDKLTKELPLAERDNDYIYHNDVPDMSALPAPAPASIVQPIVPPLLQDPKKAVGEGRVVLGELLAWGAKEALNIYQHRRDDWVEEEVLQKAEELDRVADSTLLALNLPATLDALDRPVGLPPSLLAQVDEVRQDDGPARVEAMIVDVRRLARQNEKILDEAMEVLDQEAEDDEEARKDYAGEPPWPTSYEANAPLVGKEARYRAVLVKAADSDAEVRRKWEEWEDAVRRLTWDDAELEAYVPSSTGAAVGDGRGTRAAAREVRVLLESLDDLRRDRAAIVRRTKVAVEMDDIRPRILRAAANIERWAEVRPAMFEDVLEEEMRKFERFAEDLTGQAREQGEMLEVLKRKNEVFLLSRVDDPSVKERERGLQSLGLAYHKYKEIMRNLEEGLKFYNDLGGLLSKFRESCGEFARERRANIEHLPHSMQSMSLRDGSASSARAKGGMKELPAAANATASSPPRLPDVPAATPQRSKGETLNLALPPPNSDDWETSDSWKPRAPNQPKQEKEKMSRKAMPA